MAEAGSTAAAMIRRFREGKPTPREARSTSSAAAQPWWQSQDRLDNSDSLDQQPRPELGYTALQAERGVGGTRFGNERERERDRDRDAIGGGAGGGFGARPSSRPETRQARRTDGLGLGPDTGAGLDGPRRSSEGLRLSADRFRDRGESRERGERAEGRGYGGGSGLGGGGGGGRGTSAGKDFMSVAAAKTFGNQARSLDVDDLIGKPRSVSLSLSHSTHLFPSTTIKPRVELLSLSTPS